MTRTTVLDLSFQDFETEPCASLIVSSLAGEEIERRTICVPASEFPANERRAPEARSQVIQCVEPPDDTEDINWQCYGGESKVGGCSTGASGLVLWLFLGIFG